MWGFGCILYELLSYTLRDEKMSDKEFHKMRYLFAGDSCFLVSRDGKRDAKGKAQVGDQDQVKVIMQSLGP